jgi:hypothetical protein
MIISIRLFYIKLISSENALLLVPCQGFQSQLAALLAMLEALATTVA